MIRRWDKSKPPTGPFALNRECPQAQGLVAWWPMGGVSGRNYAADLANKYHAVPGAAAGSAALGTDGRPGLQLTAASNQYLINTALVSSTPLSMSAWGATDGSVQTAIQVVDTGININNFCRIVLVSNKVRANVGTFTSGSQANAITTASYVNGELSLFSASFTSDTSRTVYLNGSNAVTDFNGIVPTGTNKRVLLGAAFTTSDAVLQPWNGFLGECAVWSRSLPADMHARLYDHGTRYELWYPLRSRKWIVGAAATVPTLSASTYVPGSLTSTGWRPQITAS